MVITKEKILSELRLCSRDPVHFIKNYVKIRHPTRGLIPFATFDYQEELIKNYTKHRFNIILKARQLGISEITASFAAWLMLFRRQRTILVIATKEEVAKNLLKKIHTALKFLPSWMCVSKGSNGKSLYARRLEQDFGSYAAITVENKTSIELSTGSVAKAIASREDAGHSEAVSFFIVDEASRINNLEEIWKGVWSTVNTGGRIAVLSTPWGAQGHFYNLWQDAMKGNNDFHPTKLMWYVHPEHVVDAKGTNDLTEDPYHVGWKTSSWLRQDIKAANLSIKQIAEQYMCSFEASGDTVISPEQIEWIAARTVLDPIRKEYLDRKLFIWNEALRDVKYLISADVARGDGKDYSAAIVWNTLDMSQAAEYYGKVPPEEFAFILTEMGKTYNEALLVVENNSLGLACLDHLRLRGYPNVYFSRKNDMRPGEAINMNWGALNPDLVAGFTTSAQRRALMIAKFEEYIRNQTIHIRSERLVDELRTFVWSSDRRSNNAKAEASVGSHDDLVMAAAMGVWIKDTFISPSGAGLELQRKMLDSMSSEIILNTEIPGANKDPRFCPQRSLGIFISDNSEQVLKVRAPGGRMIDFSWLLKD